MHIARAKQIYVAVVIASLSTLVGCQSLPPQFANHICPPPRYIATPSMTYAQGVQFVGDAGQAQGVQQASYAQGAQQMMTPQMAQPQMVQPAPIAQGEGYLQNGPTLAPDQLGQNSPTSVDRMNEVTSQLARVQQENATLRESMTKLKTERQEYGDLATKATQQAKRLQAEKTALNERMASLGTELKQMESVVRKQKREHENVLNGLEGELDTLLTVYEENPQDEGGH